MSDAPPFPPLRQMQLKDAVALPFCAFNGGSDVFVDIGNKSLGLDALLHHLDFQPEQVTP